MRDLETTEGSSVGKIFDLSFFGIFRQNTIGVLKNDLSLYGTTRASTATGERDETESWLAAKE